MELLGIGEKTADVLLSSRYGYHEVFLWTRILTA